MEDSDDYGNLEYQRGMLEDEYRTKTYYQAILDNKDLFKNKVVVDVGCGTGILSFFAAQAGAKKVYAIEATGIINTAQFLAKKNKYNNIIFINAMAEEVNLPEKVDIIISEWMGHYLFHERMFESVINIRDRYLKPDGILFPQEGTINIALYSGDHWINKDTEFWMNKNFYGVDLSSIGQDMIENRPTGILVVDIADPEALNSNENVMNIDFKTITMEEIQKFTIPLNFKILDNKIPISSLCLWFTVGFPGKSSGEPQGKSLGGTKDKSFETQDKSLGEPQGKSFETQDKSLGEPQGKSLGETRDKSFETHGKSESQYILDTSPNSIITHWKQAFIYFDEPFIAKEKELDGFLKAKVDTELSYELSLVLFENHKICNKVKISSWGIKYI